LIDRAVFRSNTDKDATDRSLRRADFRSQLACRAGTRERYRPRRLPARDRRRTTRRADKFQDDLDKLTAGLPKDAAAMVERRASCNHWQGEEPYDKARGREIDRALTRFGCDFIARDEEKLRARYADKPAIIKALVRGGIFRAPPPRRKVAASVANGTMTTPWHG
jgi:hypothetical protein